MFLTKTPRGAGFGVHPKMRSEISANHQNWQALFSKFCCTPSNMAPYPLFRPLKQPTEPAVPQAPLGILAKFNGCN
ncbi:MAG: hypothetical protein WCR20_12200, partial [Verrucomicrobiota bacterium]